MFSTRSVVTIALTISAAYAVSVEQVIERAAEKLVRDLGLEKRTTANITSAQLNSYDQYTALAGAAYCNVNDSWSCSPCTTYNSDFQIAAFGGNGDSIQYWYVGYSPSLDTVIAAHQGTEATQFLSYLTDLDAVFVNLNSTYFPGVSSSVMAHRGFADEQADTAADVLAAVNSVLSSTGSSTVTAVGHSLGAAIALLDSLMFSINLPSSISVQARLFGTPRVGNPDFANLIDSAVPNHIRINHAYDPIPILPGMSLGFLQPNGEVHILSTTENIAITCSGNDDDTDADCTDQYLDNNIFNGNIEDHLGPYPGSPEIYLGTSHC